MIYGHNLHTGSMFSGLLNYRDGEFYLQNPTFTLYTPDETQTYRIFSCHTATDMEDLYDTNRTAGKSMMLFCSGSPQYPSIIQVWKFPPARRC